MTEDRRQSADRRQEPRGTERRQRHRSVDDVALSQLIAGRLKRAMRRKGLSVAVVAQLAIVSESAVRYILAGENTSLDTLRAVAAAVDVALPALLAPIAA